MTKPAMTRDRALALLLALLALITVIALVAVPVWMRHQYYDAYISDAANKLARYDRANRSRPQLIKQLETLRTRDPQKLYLKGTSPALASAELQDIVKGILESSGARLITIQANAREEGGYRQATTTVQMSATIPNLRKVFYAIESSQPLLFIDTLNIRSQVPPGYKASPGVEPEMYLTVDVSGFALSNAASAVSPTDTRSTGSKS